MTKLKFATEQSSRSHSRVPREMRRCTNGNFRCASCSRQQIILILTSTHRKQDVHAAYKKAKAKQDELWSQLKDREKDIRELQVRYEEKSREKRSLEDFTARRGSLSEGARTFGARPVQAIPRTVAQIDTRIQTEKNHGNRVQYQLQLMVNSEIDAAMSISMVTCDRAELASIAL